MGHLTRRQILLGGGAIVGAGLAPIIPATTGSSALKLISAALGADIPKPDQLIRMSANENPYGPSRVALKAIAENIHLTNRYAADPTNLINLVADINNISPDHVMTGTGSSEILNVAGMLLGLRQGSVVCADPTYQALLRYAANAGVEIIRVRVAEGLNADLEGMRKAVRNDTNMMYIVNPNNPIPSVIEKSAMKEFVLEQAEDRLVFVDEAYHEYVDNPDYESMVGLIAEGHNNIIVSRTASKIHGLAGMRVGFGFAHPDLIKEMNMRKTGEQTILGQRAAYASYQDMEFLMHFLPSQALEKNGHRSAGIQSAYYRDLEGGHRIILGTDLEYTSGYLSEVQSLPTLPFGGFAQGVHYNYEIDSWVVAPYFHT
ncbi:MAG: aminotransferase class I/II-fold pyridoxal phosphate-dependent enzyme, partial [Proteobacteria bacterium]|nr:aminotransferase class I/II-fold pyridoxal phosphate-dependent enzyme [Pseudomonadota bacterium]